MGKDKAFMSRELATINCNVPLNLRLETIQLGKTELAEIAWEESLKIEPENTQVRIVLEQLRDELSFKQFQNL